VGPQNAIYRVQKLDNVEHIAMNSLQRKIVCSTVDTPNGTQYTTSIAPFTSSPSEYSAYSAKFEIDSLSKLKAEVAEDDVIAFLKQKESAAEVFFKGSVFCIKFKDIPLKLTCTSIVRLPSNYSPEDGLELEEIDIGFMQPDTRVTITPVKDHNRLFTLAPSRNRATPLFEPGWKFEDTGVGGLDKEFSAIFRRAFASRMLPIQFIERTGIKHVKGMLLYGPPGTGKTLIARQIGKMLGGIEPKIVNGPEILNKYVGQAEENIRNLFADAVKDYEANKETAQLHVIIFDEIDAICKARGSVGGGTGVHDTVVNQLLTMIDGINTPNNILVIGMTNRKDMLDPALLRPGRLEVMVEISLPDEAGRVQILNIHTKTMRQNGILSADVDIPGIAANTRNFSGAEIEGLVKSATSYAIASILDVKNLTVKDGYENMKVTQEHFDLALSEIKPAFGVDEEQIDLLCRDGILEYSPAFADLHAELTEYIDTFKRDDEPVAKLLLHGVSGAGTTALAAQLAKDSGFPFVKLVSPSNYRGLSENAKANEVGRIFEEAYKSPNSVIIIDNIEALMEYTRVGPRFSNTMLQTFITLLKAPHPKPDRKLLVIVATSMHSVIRLLQMESLFNNTIELPVLSDPQAVQKVLEEKVFARVKADAAAKAKVYDSIKDLFPPVSIKNLLDVSRTFRNKVANGKPASPELLRKCMISCAVKPKDELPSFEMED
jgi:vesicle-fusing ATPase